MITFAIRLALVLVGLAARPAAADILLLTGYVTDDAGRRLPGVSIVLVDPEARHVAAAVTDAAGWYRLHAPRGRYELWFSRAAYGRATRRVDLADGPVMLVPAVLAPPRAPAREDELSGSVNQITIGSDRFRRTLFGISPRAQEGRLHAAFETLRVDGSGDTFGRYGRLNGMVRYRPGGARPGSSITANVAYGRLAGAAAGESHLMSLGLAYGREWAISSRLSASAGFEGRLGGGIGSPFGAAVEGQYRPRPWLAVDTDLEWSASRAASAGVSLGEVNRWSAGARLHHMDAQALRVHAEAGYRVTRHTKLVADVLNLTDAPVRNMEHLQAPSGLDPLTRDARTNALAPRTVRLTVQFGF